MSNIKFLQLNQQKSVTSLKQAVCCCFLQWLFTVFAFIHVCVPTLNWELHTHTQTKSGRHERKQQVYLRGEISAWGRLKQTLTYPVKNIFTISRTFPSLGWSTNHSLNPPQHVPLWIPWLNGALEASQAPFYTCVSDPDQCWLQINHFYETLLLFVFCFNWVKAELFRNYVWFLYFRMKKGDLALLSFFCR